MLPVPYCGCHIWPHGRFGSKLPSTPGDCRQPSYDFARHNPTPKPGFSCRFIVVATIM